MNISNPPPPPMARMLYKGKNQTLLMEVDSFSDGSYDSEDSEYMKVLHSLVEYV